MKFAVIIASLTLVVGINIWAMLVGKQSESRIHKSARRFGLIGLISLAAFVLICIDAFTQIWVKREGYEWFSVVYAFWVLIGCTLLSFALTVIIRFNSMKSRE